MDHNLVLSQQVDFQQYGTSYQVNTDEIPTYFFADSEFFRGYFEVYFDNSSQLQGNYKFMKANCPSYVAADHLPTAVVKNSLDPQVCVQWDLTKLSLESGLKEKVTFRVHPEFSLQIDPFSVRFYAYSLLENGFQFIPLSPNSETHPSTLGPWEFTFNINTYLQSQFQFASYAYAHTDAEFGVPVYINYPRDVSFKKPNYKIETLKLTYENATLIDPTSSDVPYVTVTQDTREVDLIDDYVKLDQFFIIENNVDRYGLDETRHYSTSYFNNVDEYSVKCAYSYSDSNFRTLIIDPTSTISIDTQYHRTTLSCKQIVTETKYVMVIIGKSSNFAIGFENADTVINSKTPVQMTIQASTRSSSTLFFEFNEKCSLFGSYKVTTNGIDKYAKAKVGPTIQQPLTLHEMFIMDFTKVSVNANSNQELNNVKITMNPKAYLNADPFSLRAFVYNEETETFELLGADIPSINSRIVFNFNVGKLILTNRTSKIKVFAIGYYTNTEEKIGELVYVNYDRSASFRPNAYTYLTMKFDQVYKEDFLYEHRPYFTLNQYTPDLGPDFTVVYGVMQQNGNGLETYNFKEKRTYFLSYNYEQYDQDGNYVPIKFSDLTCIYLFKETNFKKPELAAATASFSTDMMIECNEDIRDESFVFVLGSKKFQAINQAQTFDLDFVISPNICGNYAMQPFNLPDDIFTVSYAPDSRTTGYYRVSRDKRRYGEYTLPNMDSSEPLEMIGVLLLDFHDSTLSTSTAFDGKVLLKYQKHTKILNLDPYAYKFFSINDDQQAFEWLNSSEEPSNKDWQLKLDTNVIRKFKFAIFGNFNYIGKFDNFYSLHYDRSLQFTLPGGELKFTFKSPQFPQFDSTARFALQQKYISSILRNDSVIIRTTSIIQTVRRDITTTRTFTYTKHLKDNTGKKVDDLFSLQCIYLIAGKPMVVGMSSIDYNSNTTTFTLECSDFISSEMYDFVIIAETTPIPPLPSVPDSPPRHSSSIVENSSSTFGFVIAMSAVIVVLLGLVIVLLVSVIYLIALNRKLQNFKPSQDELLKLEEMKYYSSNL